MSEKLEQAMKKIHIYLANCKDSAYSSEEVIVSKKRIFSLLDELNYAVYEVMEEYEATTAARDRGQAAAERMAADIKEDAMKRAEEVYASSLLYTQDAIADVRNALEYTYQKTKTEYEALIQNYEDKMMFLVENSQEINAQLESMADAKVYLHIVEEIKAKYAQRSSELEELKQNATLSKSLGSITAAEALEAEKDDYTSKLSAPIVVDVHEAPQIPEGFGKSKAKKKGKRVVSETAAQSQNLDAEYFAFQEEQERALAKQLEEEASSVAAAETDDEEELQNPLMDAIRKLAKNGKKKA